MILSTKPTVSRYSLASLPTLRELVLIDLVVSVFRIYTSDG